METARPRPSRERAPPQVFVELALGEEEHHTSYQCVAQPGMPVAWNENFTFHVMKEDATLAVSVLDCPERGATRPPRAPGAGPGTTLRGGAGGAGGDRDVRTETFLGGFKVNVGDLKEGVLVDKWFVLSLSGTGEKAITAFDNTLSDMDPFKAADLAATMGGTRTARAVAVGNIGGAGTGPGGVNAARGPPAGAAVIHVKMRYESTAAAQKRREAAARKETTMRRAEHTSPWRGAGTVSDTLMMERAMLDDRRAYQRALATGTARRAGGAGPSLFFEEEAEWGRGQGEGSPPYLVHTRASLARQQGHPAYGVQLAHSTRRRRYGQSASPERRRGAAGVRTVPGQSDVDLYLQGGGTYLAEREAALRMRRAALAGPKVDSRLEAAFAPPRRETLAEQRAAAGLLAELHALKKRLRALERGGAAAAAILRQGGTARGGNMGALYDEIMFLKKRLNAEAEELTKLRHDAVLQEERATAQERRALELEREKFSLDAAGDSQGAGLHGGVSGAAWARAVMDAPDEGSREEIEERGRLAAKADALRKLACERETQLDELYALHARGAAEVTREALSAAPRDRDRDGTAPELLEREARKVQRLLDSYKAARKENHALALRVNDTMEEYERLVSDIRLRKSRLSDMTSKEHRRVLDGMQQELKNLRQQVREMDSEIELQRWRHKQQEEDGEFRERALREKLDRRAEREERLLKERDQFLGQLRVYRPEWVDPGTGLVQVPMARIGGDPRASTTSAPSHAPFPDYSLPAPGADPRDRSYRPYPGPSDPPLPASSGHAPVYAPYNPSDRDRVGHSYPSPSPTYPPAYPSDRDRPYTSSGPGTSSHPYPPTSPAPSLYRTASR
eukprot:tig00021726_g23258.t1